MRASWLIIAIVVVGAPAYAGHSTVIVMAEPARAGELASALQVAVSGRGVAIATVAAPEGALRLDRAAAAQRSAIELGAEAALWVDEAAEVCAVSSDGRYFRHVPLPANESPRVFAAIATSLLDEVLAPPEAPPGVSVDVNVNINAPGFAPVTNVAPPPMLAAPAPAAVVAAPVPEARTWPTSTLVEVGAMVSPITIGVAGGPVLPLSPAVRLALTGGISLGLDGSHHPPVYNASTELRYVGTGRHHSDFGMVGGFATAEGDTIGYFGVRLAYEWDHVASGASLALVPLIATDGRDTVPGIYGTLSWDLPL